MKKRLIVLGAALSAGAVLVGSAFGQAKRTEVTFLYGLGGELGKAIEVMIKSFNESQSEVTVKGEFSGSNYEAVVQKALAGIAAGAPAADILQLEVSYWPRLAAAGALEELSGYDGFKPTFDNFWPVFKRQADPDGNGKVFALPWNNSNPVTYYNPELFAKAGVKESDIRTYAGLREAAKKIKAATGQPAVAVESFPWVLEGAIASNNGEIVKNNRLNLDSPEALEVINTWAGFFRDGTAVVSNANSNLDFCAGKFAVRFSSVASRPQIKANCKFAFRVAPLPYFKKPSVPVGGATLAISKGIPAERKPAAWKFMRWLAQPEQQFAFIKMSNYVPITRPTSDLKAFKEYVASEQGLDMGVRQLPFARPRPSTGAYFQVTTEIVKSLESIYLNNTPVTETIKDLVARTAPLFTANK
jgi:sn-glycerol 3-phosphate transport system substrate-binding protein